MLYLCCSFSNTFSAFPFRLQESVGWETKRPRLKAEGEAVGIWNGELRQIIFDCWVVSTLFFSVYIHLNLLSTTTGGQGQGGTGRSGLRLDQRGLRQKHRMIQGDRSNQRVRPLSEYDNRRGGMKREQ